MRTLRRNLDQQLYTVQSVNLLFTLTVVEVDYKLFLWTGTLTDLTTRSQLFSRNMDGSQFDINGEVAVAREMLLTATSTITEIKENSALRAGVMKLISDI